MLSCELSAGYRNLYFGFINFRDLLYFVHFKQMPGIGSYLESFVLWILKIPVFVALLSFGYFRISSAHYDLVRDRGKIPQEKYSEAFNCADDSRCKLEQHAEIFDKASKIRATGGKWPLASCLSVQRLWPASQVRAYREL